MSFHQYRYLKNLSTHDFKILLGIEKLLKTQEFPRVIDLPKKTGFTVDFILKRLSKLNSLKLIEVNRVDKQIVEVTLVYKGYDYLALHDLTKNETIAEIGKNVGVGKESEIYLVRNDYGRIGVLKIHRLGKGNFRSFKRTRTYIAERHHSSRMYDSTLAAQHESQILKKVNSIVSSPKLWGNNRHCVVMDYINGIELYRLKNAQDYHYKALYEEIMTSIQKLLDINVIHADLSPYNILLTYNEEEDKYKPYIIDWPQAITKDHPNAFDRLYADIFNIINFFSKKIPTPVSNLEDYVRSLL